MKRVGRPLKNRERRPSAEAGPAPAPAPAPTSVPASAPVLESQEAPAAAATADTSMPPAWPSPLADPMDSSWMGADSANNNVFTMDHLLGMSTDMDWSFSWDNFAPPQAVGLDGAFTSNSLDMNPVVQPETVFQAGPSSSVEEVEVSRSASFSDLDSLDAPNSLSSIPSTSGSSFVLSKQPSPMPARSVSISHHEHSFQGCLTRCLCFLEELSPHAISDSAPLSEDGSVEQPSASFEAVLSQTQTAIDAVDDMLKCRCSRNLVLACNLGLTVSRTLQWYDACLCPSGDSEQDDITIQPRKNGASQNHNPFQQNVRRPSQVTLADYDVEPDQWLRVSCQMVLPRLHATRATLKVLCPRLADADHYSDPSYMLAQDESKRWSGSASNQSPNPVPGPENFGDSLARNLQCNLNKLVQKCVRLLSES